MQRLWKEQGHTHIQIKYRPNQNFHQMRNKGCLIIGLILFLFSACKQDGASPTTEKANSEILGKWVREESFYKDKTLQVEYSFRNDSTFEILQKVVDPPSGTVVGFRQRAVGTYQVVYNQLTLSYEQFYNASLDNDLFGSASLEDLAPAATDFYEKVTLSFDNAKSVLILQYPPCAPNEYCKGFITLYRL